MSDKEKSNSMETHVQSDTCTFIVRPAIEKDVKEIFRLTSEVHWNFSLEAVKADFHSSQTKPEGFFVAEVDGDVIGCSFGNILNEDICVIGYLIVTESWRKQGIGRTLLDKVCEFAENRQICLFSAPYLVDMYKRRGFKGTNWGIGWPTWTADPSNLTSLQKYSIKNFDLGNWSLLLKYDSLISGMERSKWLDVWLNKKPNTVVKIAFDGAHIVGYAALQPALHGYNLRPLYADNKEAAESLLKALLEEVPFGSPCIAFTCGGNPDMLELLKKLHVQNPRNLDLFPMSKKEMPKIELSKVYMMSSASAQYI